MQIRRGLLAPPRTENEKNEAEDFTRDLRKRRTNSHSVDNFDNSHSTRQMTQYASNEHSIPVVKNENSSPAEVEVQGRGPVSDVLLKFC